MKRDQQSTIFVMNDELVKLAERLDRELDEERAVALMDLDEVCGDDICTRADGYCHWCGRGE